MTTVLLTIYVLIWPVIVLGVLFVLLAAFMREWREAKREGKELI